MLYNYIPLTDNIVTSEKEEQNKKQQLQALDPLPSHFPLFKVQEKKKKREKRHTYTHRQKEHSLLSSPLISLVFWRGVRWFGTVDLPTGGTPSAYSLTSQCRRGKGSHGFYENKAWILGCGSCWWDLVSGERWDLLFWGVEGEDIFFFSLVCRWNEMKLSFQIYVDAGYL